MNLQSLYRLSCTSLVQTSSMNASKCKTTSNLLQMCFSCFGLAKYAQLFVTAARDARGLKPICCIYPVCSQSIVLQQAIAPLICNMTGINLCLEQGQSWDNATYHKLEGLSPFNFSWELLTIFFKIVFPMSLKNTISFSLICSSVHFRALWNTEA